MLLRIKVIIEPNYSILSGYTETWLEAARWPRPTLHSVQRSHYATRHEGIEEKYNAASDDYYSSTE